MVIDPLHYISKKALGRINDFLLTAYMAALLCTPLQHCYGCSEAMNSCWSITFYMQPHRSKMRLSGRSGSKLTERNLEMNVCVLTI